MKKTKLFALVLVAVISLMALMACDTENCEHDFAFKGEGADEGIYIYVCTKCGTEIEQKETVMESGIVLTDEFSFVESFL